MRRIIVILLCALMVCTNVYADGGYLVKYKGERAICVDEIPEHPDKEIEYIEPNAEVSLFSLPSDPNYSDQRNLSMMNSQYAWEIGCYGTGVKIGVIDSGIYMNPDMGNVAPGYNFINNSNDVTDNIGHGTFVSGIISARWNASGIAGMARDAYIVPIKCFDANAPTYLNMITDGIYAAVDVYGCKIINMSFGLYIDSNALSDAINYAASRGVLMVASVGNEGTNQICYPAAYDGVIGVGSVNESGSVSTFSNKNESVKVTAPGENILSLSLIDSITSKSGTSYCAPCVTSALATALCINPSLDSKAALALISDSCDDRGDVGYDTSYGYGILNIRKLLQNLLTDTSFFISPPSPFDGHSEITVLNNTDNATSVSLAQYSNDKLENVMFRMSQSRSATTFTYDPAYEKSSLMIWNPGNLQPLIIPRIMVK